MFQCKLDVSFSLMDLMKEKDHMDLLLDYFPLAFILSNFYI